MMNRCSFIRLVNGIVLVEEEEARFPPWMNPQDSAASHLKAAVLSFLESEMHDKYHLISSWIREFKHGENYKTITTETDEHGVTCDIPKDEIIEGGFLATSKKGKIYKPLTAEELYYDLVEIYQLIIPEEVEDEEVEEEEVEEDEAWDIFCAAYYGLI